MIKNQVLAPSQGRADRPYPARRWAFTFTTRRKGAGEEAVAQKGETRSASNDLG